MDSPRFLKLQYLLINQLLKNGKVELLLPDGITLEIGITQEDEHGKLKKTDDYCYVVTSRSGKSTLLDSYNLSLQFEEQKDTIVFEDLLYDDDGKSIHTLEVV